MDNGRHAGRLAGFVPHLARQSGSTDNSGGTAKALRWAPVVLHVPENAPARLRLVDATGRAGFFQPSNLGTAGGVCLAISVTYGSGLAGQRDNQGSPNRGVRPGRLGPAA